MAKDRILRWLLKERSKVFKNCLLQTKYYNQKKQLSDLVQADRELIWYLYKMEKKESQSNFSK